MLLLLSPAKTLDFETPAPPVRSTRPLFSDRAGELIGLLRTHDEAGVARLMALSPKLAALNVARYAAWRHRSTAGNSKPAIFAFDGDVYGGLDSASLQTDDVRWAQRHVVILSGLYGLLRPLDRLQPYRLEMGTALPNPRGRDLYAYWGPTLAKQLDRQLAGTASPVLVNLASQEYFRAVERGAPAAKTVHCVFEEWQRGAWRVVSFHAKRARGLMARYAIQRRARSPRALEGFDLEGYAFAADASESQRLVFRRRSA